MGLPRPLVLIPVFVFCSGLGLPQGRLRFLLIGDGVGQIKLVLFDLGALGFKNLLVGVWVIVIEVGLRDLARGFHQHLVLGRSWLLPQNVGLDRHDRSRGRGQQIPVSPGAPLAGPPLGKHWILERLDDKTWLGVRVKVPWRGCEGLMVNQLAGLFGGFGGLQQRPFPRDQRAVVVSFSDLAALFIGRAHFFDLVDLILLLHGRSRHRHQIRLGLCGVMNCVLAS